MPTTLTYRDIEDAFLSFKIQFEGLSDEPQNEMELYNAEDDYKSYENKFMSWLDINFTEDIAFSFRSIWSTDFDEYPSSYFGHGFSDDVENFIKKAQIRVKFFNNYLSMIKLCDPLIKQASFEFERSDFSIQEKKDFLLRKLYELRKIDRFWPAILLFALNDVSMDNSEEAIEIVQLLKKGNLVTTPDYSYQSYSKITVNGKSQVEKKLQSVRPKKNNIIVSQESNSNSMDIFITHSNQDRLVAKKLIELIRSALNISADKIRCTSVDGYRLPVGASTDEQLKNEVNDCKVLIGILSENSVNSPYVLFELGARWGMSKPMFPLVASEKGMNLLKGPLSGINSLDLTKPAQIHQLLTNLSELLKIKSESAAVYQDKLDELAEYADAIDLL